MAGPRTNPTSFLWRYLAALGASASALAPVASAEPPSTCREDPTVDGCIRDAACKLDDAIGCQTYAKALYFGIGVGRSLRGALASFEKGCRLGGGGACFNAAVMRTKGEGCAPEPAVAQSLLKRGCELGDADACAQLPAAARP